MCSISRSLLLPYRGALSRHPMDYPVCMDWGIVLTHFHDIYTIHSVLSSGVMMSCLYISVTGLAVYSNCGIDIHIRIHVYCMFSIMLLCFTTDV